MHLKKLIPATLLLLSITIDSCKKGEDDPALPFRTRKNRVVGEWKIKQGTYHQRSSGPGQSTIDDYFTYTENQYTLTHKEDQLQPETYKGTYIRTFKFEKTGTVRVYEAYDNITYTTNGTWDFNGGIGKEKKKELITIHYTGLTQQVGHITFTGNQKDLTYEIKELRNKKIVLIADQVQTNTNGTQLQATENLEMVQ